MLKHLIITIYFICQLVDSNLAIKCSTTNDGVKDCDFCKTTRSVSFIPPNINETVTCENSTCDVDIVVSTIVNPMVSVCCNDKRCYTQAPNTVPNSNDQVNDLYCQTVTNKNGSNATTCSNSTCIIRMKLNKDGDWISKSDCCTKLICLEPEIGKHDKPNLLFQDIHSSKSCPDMWSYFEGHCYRSFKKESDYHKSRVHCQQLHNSDLVSITSKPEQEFIIKEGLAISDQFIGLRRLITEDKFSWVDGSKFEYSNWSDGQPSSLKNEGEICVEMSKSGKWETVKCATKLGYMCKYKLV